MGTSDAVDLIRVARNPQCQIPESQNQFQCLTIGIQAICACEPNHQSSF